MHLNEQNTRNMSTQKITVNVNGTEYTHDVEPRLLLVHYIREVLNLTGTHIGCDTSNCGACTILLDGKALKSCTMLAVQANGKEILTVEGLAPEGEFHPIQERFKEEHGLQCGFCTPGMMMRSIELLKKNPDPSEEEIRWGISLIVQLISSSSQEYRMHWWAQYWMRLP